MTFGWADEFFDTQMYWMIMANDKVAPLGHWASCFCCRPRSFWRLDIGFNLAKSASPTLESLILWTAVAEPLGMAGFRLWDENIGCCLAVQSANATAEVLLLLVASFVRRWVPSAPVVGSASEK